MPGAFEGPIHLAVGRSRRLAVLDVALHLAASAWLLVAFPASAVRGVLLAALVVSLLVRLLARRCRRAADVVAVLLDSSDHWQVRLRDGSLHRAELCRPALASAVVTCLALRRADGRVHHVALLADNAAPAALRRLRVRLRWPRRAGVAR